MNCNGWSACIRTPSCRCADAKGRKRCRASANRYCGRKQPIRPGRWTSCFDRSAEGRVNRALTIVDDATHEAVAIEVERAISGYGAARVLDRLALTRGLPQARTEIETGRREYNEERSKKILDGLTSATYAQQSAAKAAT